MAESQDLEDMVESKVDRKAGVSPGAVIIVKVDHCAVSHAIGIVEIIFQVREGGGAKVDALIIDNPHNDY